MCMVVVVVEYVMHVYDSSNISSSGSSSGSSRGSSSSSSSSSSSRLKMAFHA